MNTLNVLLVDDEPEACENLQNILSQFIDQPINILGFAHSTSEAEAKIAQYQPDAIFLDIEMPNENAFQFLERMHPFSFEIIFVTAYDDYAIRAFKLNAIDYILKPINIAELGEAVKKLKEKLLYKELLQQESVQYAHLSEQINQKKKQQQIMLRDKNDLEAVPFKKILYVKAMGSYSKIVFNKGNSEKNLLMSRSIAEYENLFPDDMFFRAHKSYLVNCFFIKKIIKDEHLGVLLENGEILPVSRRRLSDLILFLKTNHIDEVK